MEGTTGRKTVLFVCTHNSVRSQMAEGLLNGLYGGTYEARSAGTKPTRVSPRAVSAMREIGIDISAHRSKSIEEFRDSHFDCVVTVCDDARESCPFFAGGGEHIHRGFADPGTVEGTEEEKSAAFRRARDEIHAWIDERFGPGNQAPGEEA